MLDLDDGARRLGELGIGCNPGITQHMKNTLFDEKIDGTVHVALGNGLPDVGGTNVSQLHWDIVKDMRRDGSRIELDGKPVQESGRWLL
jgi:aminopeptidase